MQSSARASKDIQHAASRGIGGGGGALPHREAIQRSFGGHDVGHVRAHVGGQAAEATRAMGAEAYASGDDVAFEGTPDLWTAAHEAAHVIQQAKGVQLKGGVGQVGDAYETHANQVADLVVQGKSAEGLLSSFGGGSGGGGSGGRGASVQRASSTRGGNRAIQMYTKEGNVRVSDNKDLVVVDGAPHNHAYATGTKIAEGQNRLQSNGSHVALEEGAAVTPGDLGVDPGKVANNLKTVVARPTVPAGDTQERLDTQDDTSQVVAHQFEMMAENELAKLGDDDDGPDGQLIAEVDGDEAVKGKVERVYAACTGDYSPPTIVAAAKRLKLDKKYVKLILRKIIEYQKQIRAELDSGGFTTPKDCGQVARKFVRGTDVRYHALSEDERKAKGYTGHYFSMVLEDGGDKVSLENAVGESKLEQLWKSATFDAAWHYEMRGNNRPDEDRDEAEMHGEGASKQTLVSNSDDAIRDLGTQTGQVGDTIARNDTNLTKSVDSDHGKDGYAALRRMPAVVDGDDVAKQEEQQLLRAGLVYANDHVKRDHTGRQTRVDGWKTAVQRCLDRGTPNQALAEHVKARLALVES